MSTLVRCEACSSAARSTFHVRGDMCPRPPSWCQSQTFVSADFGAAPSIDWAPFRRTVQVQLERLLAMSDVGPRRVAATRINRLAEIDCQWFADVLREIYGRANEAAAAPAKFHRPDVAPLAPPNPKVPTYKTTEERLAAYYARADAAIAGDDG